jgi:hypothetical protein
VLTALVELPEVDGNADAWVLVLDGSALTLLLSDAETFTCCGFRFLSFSRSRRCTRSGSESVKLREPAASKLRDNLHYSPSMTSTSEEDSKGGLRSDIVRVADLPAVEHIKLIFESANDRGLAKTAR